MVTKDKPIPAGEKLERAVKDIYISQLREGKYITLNTAGESMAPFLKEGDRIRVCALNKGNIKTGDIIVVDNEKKNKAWFYVHRVVAILKINGSKMYITKGDMQKEEFDQPVEFTRIIGKVTEIHRRNAKINLEAPLCKLLSPFLGYLSRVSMGSLSAFSFYLNLLIEWRQFPSKVKRWIKNAIH